MTDDDPITVWIDQLRKADEEAAAKLWNHFCVRLYEQAQKKLRPETRRVYDEEDASQSAFHSVCVGIASGRFPELQDRESLWRLLLVITARKVARRHRFDKRRRRDVRRNLSDSVFVNSSGGSVNKIGQLPSGEPTPEFVVEFVDTCETLFESLDNPTLQEVVRLRLEGYTDSQIGERMNCSRRTILRRMEVIRRHWKRMQESQP